MAEAFYKPFWLGRTASQSIVPLPSGPIADVLRHVPDPAALRLTEQQIDILNEALTRRRREKSHTVDYSARLRWLGKHYYFAFVAGPDLRRLPDGRRVIWPRRLVLKVGQLTGLYMLATAIAVPLLLAAYVVKSLAGIDLFDGPSVLHAVFFK